MYYFLQYVKKAKKWPNGNPEFWWVRGSISPKLLRKVQLHKALTIKICASSIHESRRWWWGLEGYPLPPKKFLKWDPTPRIFDQAHVCRCRYVCRSAMSKSIFSFATFVANEYGHSPLFYCIAIKYLGNDLSGLSYFNKNLLKFQKICILDQLSF